MRVILFLHLLLLTACIAQQERSGPLPFDVSHHVSGAIGIGQILQKLSRRDQIGGV